MPAPTVLLVLAAAGAAQASPERLSVPAYSLAAEEGASAAWVNPANLGFNPDPTLGLWYRQGLTDPDQSLALSTHAGGTGLGVLYRYDAESGLPWWGLNSALSVGLPGRVRVGTNITWSLPSGEGNNFVSYDMGVGWRPLPYFGVGGILRNLGDPAPELGVESIYGVGAVVRPFGDILEIGFDYEDRMDTGLFISDPSYAGVLHIEPVEGLDIRLRADQALNVSGGLTLWFGGAGAGVFYDQDQRAYESPGVTALMESTIGDERLAGLGSRVPVIELDHSFPYQPVSSFFTAAGESYLHLLKRLEEAAGDRSVKGVVLELDATPFSMAQLRELQAAIEDIQAAGKPVLAYLDSASNGAYLLASGCDRVYLNPAGELDLIGMSAELMFLRGAFDLIGVEPQFARRAEYKSAVEQYTRTEPSEASREQLDALLDDLYGALVAGIAAGRGIPEDALRGIIDEGPFTPEEAIAAGLVDEAIYPDELEGRLEEALESSLFVMDEDYGMLSTSSGWLPVRQIAVIYVDGPIVGGESSTPGLFSGASAGAETIVRALHHAETSDAVRAVVLRVDSPGGSAFASDQIWRAVEKVKEAGKPVIVSMGGTAASGGYYVSAGATAIYAEETTITGSIGIFGGKMSFGELYEKVGLSTELFTRGRMAAMYATSRPLDPVEFAALDRLIEHGYTQFKQVVAEGRGMSMEEVEEVARGRVWSGARAKEVGLVDEIGGIQDAIERAREEAHIPIRADVDLVTITGAEDAFGEPTVERVQALTQRVFQARAQPLPELPEPLLQWAPYLPLQDETLFAMSPWIIEIN